MKPECAKRWLLVVRLLSACWIVLLALLQPAAAAAEGFVLVPAEADAPLNRLAECSPGFEAGSDNWRSNSGSIIDLSADAAAGHTSLRIVSSADGKGSARCDISRAVDSCLQTERRYIFSVAVKVLHIAPDAHVYISISQLDRSGATATGTTKEKFELKLSGDQPQGWQTLTTRPVAFSKNATTAVLTISFFGKAEILLDELALVPEFADFSLVIPATADYRSVRVRDEQGSIVWQSAATGEQSGAEFSLSNPYRATVLVQRQDGTNGEFPLQAAMRAEEENFQPLMLHLAEPRKATGLNGIWRFATSAPGRQPSADAGWRNVVVPGKHSDLFAKAAGQVSWFSKSFGLKAIDENQRLFLCFERINGACRLYVNSNLVGVGTDGYFPQRFDVTAFVRPGENELRVEMPTVDSARASYQTPQGWRWYYPLFAGIPYPVHLELTGIVTIDDIRLLPVDEGGSRLKTVINVTNRSELARSVSLEAGIDSALEYPLQQVQLAPGESRTVTLDAAWAQPHRWWPHDPYLYFLTARIRQAGTVIDARRERFGFRTLKVKGPDLLLNDRKVFLRMDSWISYYPRDFFKDDMLQRFAHWRARGINSLRLHGGPSLRTILYADEAGMLIQPETGINTPNTGLAPEYWSAAEQHARAMVKNLWNSPSVVCWGLANEFGPYYINKEPQEVKQQRLEWLQNTGAMIAQLDPDRPWTCSGEGELGGWGKHGPMPVLDLHYPSQPVKRSMTIPLNVYWLEEGKRSWHGIAWDRAKPVFLSEDLYMPYGILPPGGMAQWAGEKAYDPVSGYYESWFSCIRMFAEGYYHAGVTVWNPWATSTGARANPLYAQGQPMPDFFIASRELNVTFWSGEKSVRTLSLYNKTLRDEECQLTATLRTASDIQTQVRTLSLKGGEGKELSLELLLPQTARKLPCTWELELRADDRLLTQRRYEYTIYPQEYPSVELPQTALLSSDAAIFAGIKFSHGTHQQLQAALNSGTRTLVIGAWSGTPQEQSALEAAVQNELRVIWFEPKESALIRQDTDGGATPFVFPRDVADPLLHGIGAGDLMLWRPDGNAVLAPCFKPASGCSEIIADCGASLRHAAMLRLRRGLGCYEFCLLPVVTRYTQEPAARYLAQQILRNSAASNIDHPGRLLYVRNQPDTGRILRELGVQDALQPEQAGVALFTGRSFSAADLQELDEFCQRGATVLIDDVQPEAAEALARHTGLTIRLEPSFATQLLINRPDSPLVRGLSNADLFWRQDDLFYKEASDRINGHRFKPTSSSMTEFVLSETGSPLRPAALATFTYLNGRFVVQSVLWRKFLNIKPELAKRYILTLLNNLGVKIGSPSIARYVPLDLAAVHNRGLWEHEGETPAWFGEPGDDLRYFPVNRPGLDPVNGMAQPPETFPSDPLTLGGINFKLTDPETNAGRACLVLAPAEEIIITLDRKIRRLWFLGALSKHDVPGAEALRQTVVDAGGAEVTEIARAGLELNGYQYLAPVQNGVCAWTGYNAKREGNVLWCWSMQLPQENCISHELKLKNVSTDRSVGILAITLEE